MLQQVKRNNKNQTHKTTSKKLKKAKESDIKIFIESKGDYSSIQIVTEGIIAPYVRNRASRAGIIYDPLNSYKKYMQKTFKNIINDKYPNYQLVEGEVKLSIIFYKTLPKNASIRKKIYGLIMKTLRPLITPDVDNVAKTIMDICNKVIWEDDNQVTDLHVKKFYGEEEKTVINIMASNEKLKIKGRASKEEQILWDNYQKNI